MYLTTTNKIKSKQYQLSMLRKELLTTTEDSNRKAIKIKIDSITDSLLYYLNN